MQFNSVRVPLLAVCINYRQGNQSTAGDRVGIRYRFLGVHAPDVRQLFLRAPLTCQHKTRRTHSHTYGDSRRYKQTTRWSTVAPRVRVFIRVFVCVLGSLSPARVSHVELLPSIFQRDDRPSSADRFLYFLNI